MKKIKQQSRESKLMLLKEYGYSVEINIGQPVWGGLLLVIDQNSTDQEFDEKIDTLLQELQNKTWLLSLKKPIIEDKCVLCDNYMFQQKMDVNRNKICNFCSCSFGHFNNIDNEFRLKIKECKNYKRPQ